MIIQHHEIDNSANENHKEIVKSISTPLDFLQAEEYDRPLLIHPNEFLCFEDLLQYRDEIQMLKLVPIKDDIMHTRYNSMDRNKLVEDLKPILGDSPATFMVNEFPYWLPPDTSQNIIWIQDGTHNDLVIEFIANVAIKLEVDPNELILFERPLGTKSLLVKGTLPAIRHIHLWKKNT